MRVRTRTESVRAKGNQRPEGTPRRRAGAGREKATAILPHPVEKGKGGSTGLEPPAPGSGTRQVPQGWGAGRGSRTSELQPPCWRHLPTLACSHPLKHAHPRGGGWPRMVLLKEHCRLAHTQKPGSPPGQKGSGLSVLSHPVPSRSILPFMYLLLMVSNREDHVGMSLLL